MVKGNLEHEQEKRNQSDSRIQQLQLRLDEISAQVTILDELKKVINIGC
jgi:hypothetical protein